MLLEIVSFVLAAAAPQPQAGSSARTANTENPDRVVCRAPERATGSRVAQRRVCKTVAEWRAYEQDREGLRRELMNTPMPH